MQGKGLITLVAIVLGLICLNELLPTWYASKIEKQATAIAGNDPVKYQKEIAKLSKDTLDLGFTELYYSKAKEKEMKLGLDLKGGINVLLEINQRDLVNNLTNYSSNPILIEALDRTDQVQKNSTKSYIDDFFIQFDAVNKEKKANLKLADPEVFGNTHFINTRTDYLIGSCCRKLYSFLYDVFNFSIGSIVFNFGKVGITKYFRICKFQIGFFLFINGIKLNEKIINI